MSAQLVLIPLVSLTIVPLHDIAPGVHIAQVKFGLGVALFAQLYISVECLFPIRKYGFINSVEFIVDKGFLDCRPECSYSPW